jgi:hypothetical protein
MGRHPWPLSLAARRPAQRARGYRGMPSRRRASRQPVAGPGRAGGKLGARPRAPPPTILPGATRPGVRPWSRFRASSASSLVYRVRLRLHYTVQRTTPRLPYASRLTHRAANTNREHTRGTIFSHLCTQGVHRRLSTFEYARPRSAWISHDYIPPPAANTLQSR